MAEGDRKESLIKEIYDFIKELYLEEEEKKIEVREKYIKNKFSINRFKREQMQYEKVNDTNIGFFNPNTNLLNEKIELIKREIEKLSAEQIEEEEKLQAVEKRMDKISIIRGLLEEKEEEKKGKGKTKEPEEKKKGEKKQDKQQDKQFQDSNAICILRTNETERKRIARDLHDTTVQNLTGLIHKVEYCSLLLDKDTVKVKLELATMQETLKNTIEEMRDIIYDLRPMSIDDLGLAETVCKYIKKLEQEYEEITFDVSIKNTEKKLDTMISLNIFRMIQEACNNAVKHGKVSLIFILIEYQEDKIIVSVEDDGIGFDYNKIMEHTEENKGFGISIMKERAKLIAGTLDIVSEKEKGTSIKLIVPIK